MLIQFAGRLLDVDRWTGRFWRWCFRCAVDFMGLGASQRATRRVAISTGMFLPSQKKRLRAQSYLMSPHVGHRYFEGSETQTSQVPGILSPASHPNLVPTARRSSSVEHCLASAGRKGRMKRARWRVDKDSYLVSCKIQGFCEGKVTIKE